VFQSDSSKLAKSLSEEALYTQAASELSRKQIRPGLWAKAFAESGGDEQKARARYIDLRVESIRLEGGAAAEQMRFELLRAQIAQKESEKEQERLRKEAETREAAKKSAEEARKSADAAMVFWGVVLGAAFVLGPPAILGSYVHQRTQSIFASGAYAALCLLFTTSFFWRKGKKSLASNLRWSVFGGVVLGTVTGWELNVPLGATQFLICLAFMGFVFFALSFEFKRRSR